MYHDYPPKYFRALLIQAPPHCREHHAKGAHPKITPAHLQKRPSEPRKPKGVKDAKVLTFYKEVRVFWASYCRRMTLEQWGIVGGLWGGVVATVLAAREIGQAWRRKLRAEAAVRLYSADDRTFLVVTVTNAGVAPIPNPRVVLIRQPSPGEYDSSLIESRCELQSLPPSKVPAELGPHDRAAEFYLHPDWNGILHGLDPELVAIEVYAGERLLLRLDDSDLNLRMNVGVLSHQPRQIAEQPAPGLAS